MTSSAPMQQVKTSATPDTTLRTSQSDTQSGLGTTGASQGQFADLRPQATAQRQLHDAANYSTQSHQLKSLQQMAHNSARATQLKALGAMMNAPAVQAMENEQAPQAKAMGDAAQREAPADAAEAPKPNHAGLPDNLKSGIESLSGMSMDHVKVHYGSAQPAQLNAHAYAQGSEIHVAPGQEQHLPHEAWHVVQQAQGRVKPTMQMKAGVGVNDDEGLEREADLMGAKALTTSAASTAAAKQADTGAKEHETKQLRSSAPSQDVMQMVLLTAASGPVRLDAEQGQDLYMWNLDQRDGEEPSDAIGSTNVFTDWAGAEATTGTFHRAHAYGKQFGGGGAASNVAWWTTGAEGTWTPLEDRMRGDNNGGNAAGWTPGAGEHGNYQVTRVLKAGAGIVDTYRAPLISALTWGLSDARAAYQAMLITLGSDALRAEAEAKRAALVGTIAATVDAFLDVINIRAAAGLIIDSMTFSYTRTDNGANAGASRANINQTVNNTHALGDFGLMTNDANVWNALRTFGGMFQRGQQPLKGGLTARLTAPAPTGAETAAMRAAAIAELTAEGVAATGNADFVPPGPTVGPRFGLKRQEWLAAHPRVTLGPIADGWGSI